MLGDIDVRMIVLRRQVVLAVARRDEKALSRAVEHTEQVAIRSICRSIRLERPLLGDPRLPGGAVPGRDVVLVAGEVDPHDRPVGAFIAAAAAPGGRYDAKAAVPIELVA
jgi:hypothetical protein